MNTTSLPISVRSVLLGALLVLTACSGTESTREVTVPAETATTRSTTDTLRLPSFPPVPGRGVPTMPIEVQMSPDTLPGPKLNVTRLTVDRRPGEGDVTLQYQVVGRTVTDAYALPAYGEALDIRPQSERVRRYGQERTSVDTVVKNDTTVKYVPLTVPDAQVRGQPQNQDIEAEVPEEDDSLWSWINKRLAWIGGFVVLGVGLYLVRTFTSLIPW